MDKDQELLTRQRGQSMQSQTIRGRFSVRAPCRVEAGGSFHVRIGVSRLQVDPLTEASLAKGLIASARRHHDLGQWWCELFLLMPDHLHAILRLQNKAEISESIGNWKRITALTHAVCWEDGFFSHPLRRRNEVDETWWHIRDNPVARGLCATEDEWRWWWSALSPMS